MSHMKEKGQALIILIGILCLLAVSFLAGWYVRGKWFLTPSIPNIDAIKIITEPSLKDGDIINSTITINNCRGVSPVENIESREFSHQIKLSADFSFEGGVSLKNAITTKIIEEFSIEGNNSDKFTKEIRLPSAPGKISVHTIMWSEKLKTGIIKYSEKGQIPFSVLQDVEVEYSVTNEKPCP